MTKGGYKRQPKSAGDHTCILYTSYKSSGHGRDDGHVSVFRQCAICKIALILDKSHHLQSQVCNLVPFNGMIHDCSKNLPKGGACSKYGLPACLHLQRNEMNRTKGTKGTKGTWMSIVSIHLLQKHRSFPLLRGIAPFTISAVVLQSGAYW